MTGEECFNMVNAVCLVNDCLNGKQRIALGKMLFDWFDLGSEEYHGAVDFLWLSDEINTNTKLELLALV